MAIVNIMVPSRKEKTIMYISVCIRVCVCVCVYTYIYTFTYMYICIGCMYIYV